MSVDYIAFESTCGKLIRRHMGDFLRELPMNERAAFIAEEATSLAYALAEVAETRVANLRAEWSAAR